MAESDGCGGVEENIFGTMTLIGALELLIGSKQCLNGEA